MKKILIATNVLLLGTVFLMAYSSGCKKPKDCSKFCYDYSGRQLKGMIDGNLLETLSLDYFRDAGKANATNPDGTTKRDALSMVFDLEKIKTLIWQIDSNMCVNGCNPKTPLGIRFYFIKYPNNLGPDGPESLYGIDVEQRNKHALVMVPVYKDADKWYDYNLWSKERGCFRPILHGPGGVDSTFFALTGGGGDEGDNHGGVAPPPEPGTFPSIHP